MKHLLPAVFLIALMAGMQVASASEESDKQYKYGRISYINRATLEIGINDVLYRLDGSFKIIGLGEGDRVQLLNSLEPGMAVDFRLSEGTSGSIEELVIPPN